MRPPPRAWRGRINRNQPSRNGVSLQQMDRIAPAFQGECQSAEKQDQDGLLVGSDPSSLPDSQECTICLEDMGASERKRMLPCQHLYHSHCIESWAVKNNACPNCRNKIFDADAEKSSPSSTGSMNAPASPQDRALPDNSNGTGRPERATANSSFVTAWLDTTSTQANSRFWVSPRARNTEPASEACGVDPGSSSLSSVGITFATAREHICSPSRTRPSPESFFEAEAEAVTEA